MKRKNIMHFRIDHNLTKAQLGQKLGVTGQYISKIENCKANGGNKFWNTFKEVYGLEEKDIQKFKIME